MDKWGRRDTTIIGSFIFCISCGLQSQATDINMMLFGRLIAGLSIGLLAPVVALYQSEVSPPSMRGALTSIYQLMITFGILMATVIDNFLVDRPGGWRSAIEVQVIPALCMIVGMPLLPRSPRWLVQVGRRDEAHKALCALRSGVREADKELQLIEESCARAASGEEPTLSDLFSGHVLKLMLVGISLQLLQQFVGMNAFMYFGPRIFGDLGFDPVKFQVLANTANFIATFPAVLFADRLGRRPLMLAGAFGMAVACFSIGAVGPLVMPTAEATGGQAQRWTGFGPNLVASMVFLFIVSFAATWGPIVWVYCAEIFPQKYRSWCMGAATAANWIGNYFIAQLTPVSLGALGFQTFHVFGVFCVLGFLQVLVLPETKGLQLEHVDELFQSKFGSTPMPEKERLPADFELNPLVYGSAGNATPPTSGVSA